MTTSKDQQLLLTSEIDALAAEVLADLERGAALSAVVLKAQRLTELAGRQEDSLWLLLETVGAVDFAGTSSKGISEDVKLGAVKRFTRLRHVSDPAKVSIDDLLAGNRTHQELPPKRTMTLSGSLANLEAIERPEKFAQNPGVTRSDIETWLYAEATWQEQQRVVNLERHELHRVAREIQTEARSVGRQIELLGVDAPVVFANGAEILQELANAVESLGRPKMAATAASQARLALLEMGRSLYKGPRDHVSPIDGEKHVTNTEINKLQAYIDQLWEAAMQSRKPMLEHAHLDVDIAYELGSKAKNPRVLSDEEAVRAVQAAYGVARAIALSGGFPDAGSA